MTEPATNATLQSKALPIPGNGMPVYLDADVRQEAVEDPATADVIGLVNAIDWLEDMGGIQAATLRAFELTRKGVYDYGH